MPTTAQFIYPTPPSDTTPSRPHSTAESVATTRGAPLRSIQSSHESQIQSEYPAVRSVSSSTPAPHESPRTGIDPTFSTPSSINSNDRVLSPVSNPSRLASPTSFDMYQPLKTHFSESGKLSSLSSLAAELGPLRTSPPAPLPQPMEPTPAVPTQSAVHRRPSLRRARTTSGPSQTVRRQSTVFLTTHLTRFC